MKEYRKYPIDSWQFEVQNGDTSLGYAEWVLHQAEAAGEKVPSSVLRLLSDRVVAIRPAKTVRVNRAALQKVVQYMWDDEEQHFQEDVHGRKECAATDHIFTSLKVLRRDLQTTLLSRSAER